MLDGSKQELQHKVGLPPLRSRRPSKSVWKLLGSVYKTAIVNMRYAKRPGVRDEAEDQMKKSNVEILGFKGQE